MNESKLKRFHIPEFEYGEEVYLRTDFDNRKYIVLGYKVYQKNITYILSHNGNQDFYNAVEISRTKCNL